MWNLEEKTFWAIHNTIVNIRTFYTADITKANFKLNQNNLFEIS